MILSLSVQICGCAEKHKQTSFYSPLQVRIHFEKRYRGSHSVDYEGCYYIAFGRKRITGTYFDGSDTFEMNYEEVNHQKYRSIWVVSRKYIKT